MPLALFQGYICASCSFVKSTYVLLTLLRRVHNYVPLALLRRVLNLYASCSVVKSTCVPLALSPRVHM